MDQEVGETIMGDIRTLRSAVNDCVRDFDVSLNSYVCTSLTNFKTATEK